MELEGLGYYLKVYLDDYMVTKPLYNERGKPKVTNSVRQILSEIIVLVPQIEKGRKLLREAMRESRDWLWLDDRPRVWGVNNWDNNLEDQECALQFALTTLIEKAINKSETDMIPNKV